jgi:anti-sigma regulatory factor (Ser/Thr protein kinase)
LNLRELSLHILDVAENGIAAGANEIYIRVEEARRLDLLTIEIGDNGKGIPPHILEKVTDPFVTSRTTRRVGLGLSLLKAAADRCEGDFDISSQSGTGTRVRATFQYGHIDRAPLGDMPGTVILLVAGHPDIDFNYQHIVDDEKFQFDTKDLRRELDEVPLTDPRLILRLETWIRESLDELGRSGENTAKKE